MRASLPSFLASLIRLSNPPASLTFFALQISTAAVAGVAIATIPTASTAAVAAATRRFARICGIPS